MTIIEIYNRFFLINLNEFPNIGIDLQINKVLFCFLIGIIVTTIVVNFRTATNSALIKKLLRHEANDKDSAKTLDELKINTAATRMTLSATGGRLAKIIVRDDGTETQSEENNEEQVSEEPKNIRESDSVSRNEESAENKSKIKRKKELDEKIDFSKARFYLSDDYLDDAKKIAEAEGASVLNTVLCCVLMIAIYVSVMFLMPSILEFIDGFLG